MNNNNYSKSQLYLLTLLRVVIGWHFLYEGLVKLANPNWSSIGFLMDSKGFLSNFFYWLASDPGILEIIDILNIAGLTLIGLGLILGSFTRLATIGGIIILAFYYLSHPPFVNLKYALPMEGNYLVVNKNLVELFALCVLLVFPTGHILGFDRINWLIKRKKIEKNNE